jgi:hypothetical protein
LSGTYWPLVKHTSVQIYLENAIGARSSKISDETTLVEKIENNNLSGYLRGVQLFFEYSDKFENPLDLLDQYGKIQDDRKELNKLRKHVENYTSWLREQYTDKTSVTYQAQFRGFLKWNFIKIKFKDFDVDSEKRKLRNTLEMDFDVLVEIANRVRNYLSKGDHFETYLITNWLHISGLGSREILTLKFGKIRPKIKNLTDKRNYIRIINRREKTNIKFDTFVYGEVLKDLKLHLRRNQEKKDGENLFGDPDRAYDRLNYRFSKTIDAIIQNHYSEDHIEAQKKKSLFTLHDYRHIFITACRKAQVPTFIENQFVAHKEKDSSAKSYAEKTQLLEYFGRVQEHLFVDLYCKKPK